MAKKDTSKKKSELVSSGGAKVKKNGTKKKHTVVGTFFKILLITLLLFLIFLIVYCIAYVHGSSVINLDDYKSNQAQTSILYAKNSKSGEYEEISTLHGEQNRIWVDLDDIPKDLQNSFICLEDKRFYSHHGVDWVRTIAAVVKYHGKQGGSTLTQQLIKNLTEENQVTVSRKFKEILSALNMERNYSKEEILEAYLNTIPLGQGCYGVQTAAKTYFGKDLSELNTAECATLASITQAPTKYNPLLHPDNNKERQELCLKDMLDEGAITEKEYKEALNYKMVYTNSDDYVASDDDDTDDTEDTAINSYYVDYVIDTVVDDLMEKYNYTESEATQMVYSGGLRIYTTENESVQKAAEYVYENRTVFPSEYSRTEDGANNTKKKVQSAITVMDYSGNVVAMVGGAGKKTINRGLNRATDAVRSPGSSIKPLSVYAPAMEKNLITYSSPIQNYALTINGKLWPQNYAGDKGTENTYVTTQYAVAHSLNTCAARTASLLGTSTCMKYLQKAFHITTLVTSGANTDNNLSSMAVGGMSNGVTTLEMCAAYCTFGNGGVYYSPTCYTKVTNYKGTKTYLSNDENRKGEQAISSTTAGIMNRVMQTVVTEGTGSGCGVTGFTSYMKTGTTSDTKDKWACGGTPYYCAAVWYGYDKQEEMPTTSYNPAARVWSAVMNRAHSGLSSKQFTYDDDIVARSYCTQSGLLAGDKCSSTKVGYYDKNNLPDTCDGTHKLTMGLVTTTESTSESDEDKSSTSSSSTKEGESEESTSESPSSSTTTKKNFGGFAVIGLQQAQIVSSNS